MKTEILVLLITFCLVGSAPTWSACWDCVDDACDTAEDGHQGKTTCKEDTICGGPNGLCNTVCDLTGNRCQGDGEECFGIDCADIPYASRPIGNGEVSIAFWSGTATEPPPACRRSVTDTARPESRPAPTS